MFLSLFQGLCFLFGFQWHSFIRLLSQKQPEKIACAHLFSPVFIGLRTIPLSQMLCCVLQVCGRRQKQGGIKAMSKHLAGGFVTIEGDVSLPFVTPQRPTNAKLQALARIFSKGKLTTDNRSRMGCYHFWRVHRIDAHSTGEDIGDWKFCTT